jgi:ABC-type phosphate transport system substrate-binding protein
MTSSLPQNTGSTRARLGRRLFVCLPAAAALALLGLGSPAARADAPAAEAFLVIVNARNDLASSDRQFLADAFLKKVSRWQDGEALRPVDLRPDTAVRHAFSLSVLRRPVAAVRSYWQQCIFSGRDVPPPELDSEAAVLRYVARHRGAVGYVSATTKVEEGVRVIAVR